MSVEENMRKQRLVFEEVLNKGNSDIIQDVFSPEYSFTSARGIKIGGTEAKQSTLMLRAAFPDLHCEVEDMFGIDDKVVTRYTLSGTFENEFGGTAPSGKRFEVPVILITQWLDGKEIHGWECMDTLGLRQQLGLIASEQP